MAHDTPVINDDEEEGLNNSPIPSPSPAVDKLSKTLVFLRLELTS